MNGWSAIVPIKPAADRKTRLSHALGAAERAALADRMFAHVIKTLQAAPAVAEIAVLAAARPKSWTGRWIADAGRGLNPELDAACRVVDARVLVIHADLPLLCVDDVEALTDFGEQHGVAIAPDRHMTGTNAIALARAAGFRFAFGPGSRARHQLAAGGRVSRQGLTYDIDTPDDLEAVRRLGGGVSRKPSPG